MSTKKSFYDSKNFFRVCSSFFFLSLVIIDFKNSFNCDPFFNKQTEDFECVQQMDFEEDPGHSEMWDFRKGSKAVYWNFSV